VNVRVIILVLVACLLSACEQRSEPERALDEFAAAVNDRRCSDAIGFVSARTRYSLDRLREKPQHPESPIALEEYYCSKFTFEDCKLGEMSLKNRSGAAATVSMPCGRTQDSFLPGFPSMFLKYEPRDWELLNEEGVWRVVIPSTIRIIELREREDQLREKLDREREEHLKRRQLRKREAGTNPSATPN
jgi:hypothetical protein